MEQTKTLTPKQDSFCVYYTTIGAETFSNGTKSAIAAGYSEKGAYARGSELLKNRKVLERISELHTENMQRNMITVDKVLADLEHDKLMARKAGQYGVAKGCTELQGKYLAMFTDNTNVTDTVRQHELDEKAAKEAEEFAKWRLKEKYGMPVPGAANPSAVEKAG
jgi:phage terminase small subunit